MHRCSAVQCIALHRVLLSSYLFIIYLYLYRIVHITLYSFYFIPFPLKCSSLEETSIPLSVGSIV